MNLTKKQISDVAAGIGVDYASLMAFMSVESGGIGFDTATGKIIIQFEPAWFKKKAPYAPSGLWSVNKVEKQSKEWLAFNDAYYKNADAAMESTSIGIGQIMGFHFKRLGYKTVGAMWEHARTGELAQLEQMAKFIATDSRLLNALMVKNWHLVAVYYNGGGYKELAEKYNREPYNISMEKAYLKYK
ncbi:N-acetylmuramidase family protein [Pedobacter sp. HDW13]|uniref:N-acetylmuramidase domain-containing protein n=1 Tax=Pedobacter sp. HDW13 TaxID=2714940 RepID=UPI00140B3452|nr:N-acetylmuramidase domain-containing protein [Pedobacter sp. HDW13]QIL41033.1 N-acetylmuramidase family protein [Pedobacter sp. HDW13]